MIRDLLAVGLGGALGSMSRFLLSSKALSGIVWLGFPVGTFSVNALGSLLIGIMMSLTREVSFSRLLLVVGFCGGFTTFSTFSSDAVKLLRAGDLGAAAAYIAMSLAVCMAATALGIWIGTTINKLTA